jgi:hypothetical protein
MNDNKKLHIYENIPMSIITAYKLLSNYFWPECLIDPQIKVVTKLDNSFFINYQCENFDIDMIKLFIDELTDISPIYKNRLYKILNYYQEQHSTDPYRYFLHEVDALIFFSGTLPLLQITFQSNKRKTIADGKYYVCQVDMSKIE